MRKISSFADVQVVLKELLDFKSKMLTQNIDLHGRKIINAGDGTNSTDYVTFQQLPDLNVQNTNPDQYYTMVWESTPSTIPGAVIPSFIAGRFRTGTPVECWLKARVAPASSTLSINFNINGKLLLATNLVLAIGATGPVFSSNFVSPVVKVPYHSEINPVIVLADTTASVISMGLVIKKDQD